MIGIDTFSYQLIHNGIISNVATAQLNVQSWDFTPVIPLSGTSNPVVILNRQSTALNLPVVDDQQKQYLGVYIMSLPTKGTLYQRNLDGSLGAVIDRPFQTQYSFPTPSIQYANKVLNVSSFWGTSPSWNPIQTLGRQDCFAAGSCTKVDPLRLTIVFFNHSFLLSRLNFNTHNSCKYSLLSPRHGHLSPSLARVDLLKDVDKAFVLLRILTRTIKTLVILSTSKLDSTSRSLSIN